jgi:ATP-dependent helicase/nuclease subunit B
LPRAARGKQAWPGVRTLRELVLGASDPEPALLALGEDALAFRRARDMLRAIEADGGPSAFEGHVGPLVPLPRHLSASRLERYAGCPFRYFAEHVLRLPPEETTADDLSPLEVGNLLHRTLEGLYRALGPRGFTTATLDADVARAAAAAAEEFATRTGIALGGVLALRVAQVERIALAYARWDLAQVTTWEPIRFEQAGSAEIAGLRFEGRLDRVDRHRQTGALRVVDYKRRWRNDWDPLLATSARRADKLQAPVYLDIAGGLALGPVETAVFHFLQSFADETPPASFERRGQRFVAALTQADWDACRPAVEEGLSTLATLLRGGWFFLRVRDREHEPCGHCDYRFVCRKNHAGARDKPGAAPELAPFFELVKR